IGYAVWLSLHEYSVITAGLSRWSGFANYRDALWGDHSSDFWHAFRTTFVFTAISVALELGIGLAMALAMHQAFRGRAVLRATVLVPWAILTVVTAMTWKTIFDPDLGFANTLLRTLHLPGGHVVWLGQGGYALAVLIFADVWKTAPFMALLLLAGLQVIPEDVYDAAKVDGATAWQRFFRITVPLMKPAILVALLFRTLDSFRIFDNIFILTQGNNGTESVSILGWDNLFKALNLGIGSAISILIFICVVIIAFVFIKGFGTAAPGTDIDKR
ncbi:MAG TPA: sugar ABC transporter permease, partial [Streptosporangiaceae bacterium]